MSMGEHDTFVDWVKTTRNGTARITTNVRFGSSYANKIAVTITLRVYDV
jgi:hypothetical protein